MRKRMLLIVVLVVVVTFAGWLRIKSTGHLGNQLLYGTDPYRLYRQACMLKERGELPERDMQRWAPIGKSMRDTLTLFPWLLARVSKVSSMDLYQVALYYPVAVYIVVLVFVWLLVRKLFDESEAIITILLLAVFPATALRSMAGFADRDALCLLLGVLAVATHCCRIQAPDQAKRWIWTFLCGAAALLLGLAWRGGGVFPLIIICSQFSRLVLGDYCKQDLYLDIMWSSVLLIGLLCFTGVYRTNILTPFAMVAMWMPLLFVLHACLSIALRRSRQITEFLTFSGRVPFGLSLSTISCFAAGICLIILANTSVTGHRVLLHFQQNFISTLGDDRVMASIAELQDMSLPLWLNMFGATYLLSSAGAMLTIYKLCQQLKVSPWASMLAYQLIPISVFYHQLGSSVALLERADAWFYPTSICTFLLVFLSSFASHYHRTRKAVSLPPTSSSLIVLLCWFSVTLFLSRGAQRYTFFLSVPAIVLAAYALANLGRYVSKRLITQGKPAMGQLLIVCVIALLFLLPGLGGYTQTSYALIRNAKPLFASSDLGVFHLS